MVLSRALGFSLLSLTQRRSFASSNHPIAEPLALAMKNKNSRTLVFNRPNHLNCFNTPMLNTAFSYLKMWENCDEVNMIFLKGRGRAFSSGGDIKFFASSIEESSKNHEIEHFIDTVYDMIHFVGTINTPVISFINGIAYGGGCSLGTLSRFTVATENAKLSLPETRFGHFCDAGSTFYLSRLNGYIGRYLELCAKPLEAEDTFCFKFETVGEILKALEKEGSKFSLETIDQICKGSPIGVALTLEQLIIASKLSLTQCLRMEHNSGQISPYQTDFFEGISSLIKKQTPQWSRLDFSKVDFEDDIEIKYIYANPKKKLKLSSEGKDCRFATFRKYGLPSEDEVRHLKRFNRKKSDKDVVSWFVKSGNNKYGVQQEVEEIISKDLMQHI